MGGEPKQFRPLGGRPTLCWAVRPLLEAVSGPVAVVLPEDGVERGEEALRTHLPGFDERLRTVAGGERRQDSVRVGIEAVEVADTVLVHDAVRPFLSVGLAARVGRRAAGGRVVVPALPVRDTLKEVSGDRVVATLERDRIVAVQTPQGFPLAVLREAHGAAASEAGSGASDDAALCERRGVPVTWVEGDPANRKLTDPDDWAWAEWVVESGRVRWR
ncbi:MAG: IspD/TarI family cytidylyltransferase [Gemmatimonadota bacterium]|nr:IspD/TarI family cytidylyltransferase [Gemmatimonadota bacterium]